MTSISLYCSDTKHTRYNHFHRNQHILHVISLALCVNYITLYHLRLTTSAYHQHWRKTIRGRCACFLIRPETDHQLCGFIVWSNVPSGDVLKSIDLNYLQCKNQVCPRPQYWSGKHFNLNERLFTLVGLNILVPSMQQLFTKRSNLFSTALQRNLANQ